MAEGILDCKVKYSNYTDTIYVYGLERADHCLYSYEFCNTYSYSGAQVNTCANHGHTQ